jgi:hypothetical protein
VLLLLLVMLPYKKHHKNSIIAARFQSNGLKPELRRISDDSNYCRKKGHGLLGRADGSTDDSGE